MHRSRPHTHLHIIAILDDLGRVFHHPRQQELHADLQAAPRRWARARRAHRSSARARARADLVMSSSCAHHNQLAVRLDGLHHIGNWQLAACTATMLCAWLHARSRCTDAPAAAAGGNDQVKGLRSCTQPSEYSAPIKAEGGRQQHPPAPEADAACCTVAPASRAAAAQAAASASSAAATSSTC